MADGPVAAAMPFDGPRHRAPRRARERGEGMDAGKAHRRTGGNAALGEDRRRHEEQRDDSEDREYPACHGVTSSPRTDVIPRISLIG